MPLLTATRDVSTAPRRRKGAAFPKPHSISPMLATAFVQVPPESNEWTFEYKWDGVRAIAYWDGRQLVLSSRNQLDITAQYPELQALGEALGDQPAVLDGEIVALDELDRPSFPKLQKRMKVTDRATARRLVGEIPVYFIIFDVLFADGRSTMSLPLSERREILSEMTLQGANWQVSPAQVGHGAQMLEAARTTMMEGIVAKRLDSTYEPGRRSPDWRKIKLVLRQEFVIGGWRPEKGSEAAGLGALQVGYYDETGKLRYAGNVGTGFSNATTVSVLKALAPLQAATNPFADKIPRLREVRFVKPKLIAEVEFRRWPDGGMIQQASFKGLRFDKDPRAVVKELHACMTEVGTDAQRHEGTNGGRK